METFKKDTPSHPFLSNKNSDQKKWQHIMKSQDQFPLIILY